jgi:hypothetical protein
MAGGGESSLLDDATWSHQWRHPGDFPSLSVSDDKERLLMLTEDGEKRKDEWRRPSETVYVGLSTKRRIGENCRPSAMRLVRRFGQFQTKLC